MPVELTSGLYVLALLGLIGVGVKIAGRLRK